MKICAFFPPLPSTRAGGAAYGRGAGALRGTHEVWDDTILSQDRTGHLHGLGMQTKIKIEKSSNRELEMICKTKNKNLWLSSAVEWRGRIWEYRLLEEGERTLLGFTNGDAVDATTEDFEFVNYTILLAEAFKLLIFQLDGYATLPRDCHLPFLKKKTNKKNKHSSTGVGGVDQPELQLFVSHAIDLPTGCGDSFRLPPLLSLHSASSSTPVLVPFCFLNRTLCFLPPN
eukprot:gene6061-4360_t